MMKYSTKYVQYIKGDRPYKGDGGDVRQYYELGESSTMM